MKSAMAEVMDCRKLIFITIMSLGVGAEAVTLRPQQLWAPKPCSKSAFDRQSKDISAIVENVALSASDNRKFLRENAKKIGLNEDAKQIRESVGTVVCPGKDLNPDGTHKNPRGAGGTIIGARDLVATNAHIFLDEQGNVRDPLSKCYFQNLGSNSVRKYLKLKDGKKGLEEAIASGYLAMGYSGHPPEQGENDWAVVKMMEDIPNVKPFKIDPAMAKSLLHGCSDVNDPNCLQMVAVSAHQEQMPITDENEPIAQVCKIMDIFPHVDSQATRFFNNCSSTPGSSASVNFLKDSTGNFIRDSERHLIPIAIFSNGSPKSLDHQPYAVTEEGVWKLNNRTLSNVIDGPFAAAIEHMSSKGNIQTVENTDEPMTPPGAQHGL